MDGPADNRLVLNIQAVISPEDVRKHGIRNVLAVVSQTAADDALYAIYEERPAWIGADPVLLRRARRIAHVRKPQTTEPA